MDATQPSPALLQASAFRTLAVPLASNTRFEVLLCVLDGLGSYAGVADRLQLERNLVSKHMARLAAAGYLQVANGRHSARASRRQGGWVLGEPPALFIPDAPQSADAVTDAFAPLIESETRAGVALLLARSTVPKRVGGIAASLGISHQLASHHLRALLKAGYALRIETRARMLYSVSRELHLRRAGANLVLSLLGVGVSVPRIGHFRAMGEPDSPEVRVKPLRPGSGAGRPDRS